MLHNPIQNHIITKLKNNQSLKYSEIQPEKTSNDLYNYHLQFLVKKGLINKKDKEYSLSKSGLQYIADPYSTTNSINSFFKINVINIVSRVNNGQIEILNQIRQSNPSYGKVGAMGGVVLKGELIEDGATRKLEQETGLKAKFKIVACERRIMYKSNELFSDLMFPIAYTNSYTGTLKNQTIFGTNIWVSIDEAIKNESQEFDSIQTIVPVLQAIKDNSIDKLSFIFKENIQKSE